MCWASSASSLISGSKIPHPTPPIRIVDVDGRVGEASVLDSATSASDAIASNASSEHSGVEVLRESRSGTPETSSTETPGGESPGGNTAEIPSHGPVTPSPSKRHTLGGKLGNVQIQIISSAQINTMPPTYEVVGQIQGRGITHAGIYVDDRLVKKIPIEDGANSAELRPAFSDERWRGEHPRLWRRQPVRGELAQPGRIDRDCNGADDGRADEGAPCNTLAARWCRLPRSGRLRRR